MVSFSDFCSVDCNFVSFLPCSFTWISLDMNSLEWNDDWWTTAVSGYDWSSIWGESACEDALSFDLEQLSYDSSVPPGQDEWPFINIYGSCNTCEASLVDFFSTEHFRHMQAYQLQGYRYGIAAAAALGLTVLLVLKQP